jgi:hypothetical protein
MNQDPAASFVPFEDTTPPFDDSPLAVGDVVTVHPFAATKAVRGVYFRVTKTPVGARGVNYVAQPLRGGQGIKAARDIFVKVTDPDELRAANGQAEAAPADPITLGSVVRFKHPHNDMERYRFAVIKIGVDSTVNLARLGGAGNRYFRSVRMDTLDVVAVDNGWE